MWVDKDISTLTCRWEFQGDVQKRRAFFVIVVAIYFLVAAYSKATEIPQTPAVFNQLLYFSLFKRIFFFFSSLCYFGKMSGPSDYHQILIIPDIGSKSQVVL